MGWIFSRDSQEARPSAQPAATARGQRKAARGARRGGSAIVGATVPAKGLRQVKRQRAV